MKYASSVLELGGMAAVSFGAYTLAPWLGWVVAGFATIIIGQALGGRPT